MRNKGWVSWTTGTGSPAPGTGTVHVTKHDGDDTWYASWQEGPHCESREGERDDVLTWAFGLPAERWELHQDSDPVVRIYLNPPTGWE